MCMQQLAGGNLKPVEPLLTDEMEDFGGGGKPKCLVMLVTILGGCSPFIFFGMKGALLCLEKVERLNAMKMELPSLLLFYGCWLQ